MGGRLESAGLWLRHVNQGRRARMERERSFLDSKSPKRAPFVKLNWVLNLSAARRRGF
jgi:hypothetical protein